MAQTRRISTHIIQTSDFTADTFQPNGPLHVLDQWANLLKTVQWLWWNCFSYRLNSYLGFSILLTYSLESYLLWFRHLWWCRVLYWVYIWVTVKFYCTCGTLVIYIAFLPPLIILWRIKSLEFNSTELCLFLGGSFRCTWAKQWDSIIIATL